MFDLLCDAVPFAHSTVSPASNDAKYSDMPAGCLHKQVAKNSSLRFPLCRRKA
jgi:hypothetical protein